MTETENTTKKGPVTKGKLRSVMEAASALTTLGEKDSESSGSAPSSPKTTPKEVPKEVKEGATKNAETPATPKESKSGEFSESPKRFLPDHKKPDAALTFPEKLMKLMEFANVDGKGKKDYCVTWLEDGKSFIITNPDQFTRQIVPKFFKTTKFSSFTRKLYRWGFRQVNRGIGPDDPIIFGNEHFQRDKAELMAKMRSITAAGSRKHENVGMFGMKRPVDESMDDGQRKRMLLDHLMHQKASMMSQNPSLYGAMSANGSLSLSNALRPSMGMGHIGQGSNSNMIAMNGNRNMQPYDMMQHQQMQGHGMQHFLQQHQQHQQNPQQQQQQQPQGNGGNNNGNNKGNGGNAQYPNSSSTAEIVNAAIAALRYA